MRKPPTRMTLKNDGNYFAPVSAMRDVTEAQRIDDLECLPNLIKKICSRMNLLALL